MSGTWIWESASLKYRHGYLASTSSRITDIITPQGASRSIGHLNPAEIKQFLNRGTLRKAATQ